MIEHIGIIGAGQMGSSIAQACILAGYHVVLHDVSQDTLEASFATLDRSLEKQVARNKLLGHEKESALAHLKLGKNFQDFQKCDLVIEAIIENESAKKTLFTTLAPHLSSSCLLATTTASFSITALGHTTDRPDKFMGIHFVNLVVPTSSVELIRGLETSGATFNTISTMIKHLNKEIIICEDYPGFLVHRILLSLVNEAAYALFEGAGTVEAIDKGMRLATNQPMGPLELADFIGLDKCVFILEDLYNKRGDSRYKPCPLLIKYVEAGWWGRKKKRGFYDYRGDHPLPTYRRPYDLS